MKPVLCSFIRMNGLNAEIALTLPGMDAMPLGGVVDHLSALGDPTRVRTLLLLARSELNVGEIAQALQLPQSTVSRHLRTLSDSGWVSARSEGTRRVYRIVTDAGALGPGVWAGVRRAAGASPEARDDSERLEAVLDDRRERARSFFRDAVGRWEAIRSELFGSRTEIGALVGLLDPEATVGDLGCGTGAFASLIAPSVRRVIAVDREPRMLDEARSRAEAFANLDVREGELESLPIETDELDLVFCLLVLHLVPDPPRVLAEAARVLRPGGTVVILDMRPHDREEYRDEMGHMWTGFPSETLTGWMTEAGFEGVQLRPVPPDPSAKGPLLFVARGRTVK